MKRMYCAVITFGAISVAAMAEEPVSSPRAVPLTRPEMKQFLDDMKHRRPRIPLPELTEEEKVRLGDTSVSYEGRLRSLYLPPGDNRFGFGSGSRPASLLSGSNRRLERPAELTRTEGNGRERATDPDMTLDYRFKTSLFWIVSRTNNCQYCLGHQESKLLNVGMKEDEIAALDGNWREFSDREQVAFALARRVTLEPHLISDADIACVLEHYTPLQTLEMIVSIAGNNSINRWKEGIGVPQSQNGGARRSEEGAGIVSSHSYLTPTSERFLSAITLVAPISRDASSEPTRQTICARPGLEARVDVEKILDDRRSRSPRLPLVEEARARDILGEEAPQRPLPQWMRLLANFPTIGKRQVGEIRRAEELGDLSPLLKAQVSWIVARQDRAWYALGQALHRLLELGQSIDSIYELDRFGERFTPYERSLFNVAKKLAASPVVLTDDDVAEAVKVAGPRDVVQLINYTTACAAFNRITESAGLQVEP